MTGTHLLYGLRVRSDVPLYQHRPVPADGTPPDVRIRRGQDVPRTEECPPGQVVAHLETDRPYYTFCVSESGQHVLRFYRTCEFVIDAELRDATMHVVEGTDSEIAGVLAAGALLSYILTMREQVVLHASAVQVGDSALAFVGRSGMGKSTMAALTCAAGASLITDDVLRVEFGEHGVACRLGATELRLRKAAAELAERFADRPPSRVTGDARDALRMVESNDDGLPLAAIVVPFPDRERSDVEVVRVPPMDAVISLLRFPRLLGWSDAAVLDRQFRDIADLVERVPVYQAFVPWGPPFAEEIGADIVRAVGLSIPSHA
ncbi:hypothetical protein G1H11_07105 [Phytoactinopolyspora alkaliphila]|uniref:HPr kinase/phosphorylase C-terminal domain-containing protein n=1 Tax=Phytoactinopolyspora alkaliphila TaxID=1783498 RepID=A0A6N9YJM2_9ACTN|nr:hypothetical protein [Phytoactinopolyspora alkaliphila]NED95079.1 hypothetical protein [Phytoactinopolyspora alkaliphila]